MVERVQLRHDGHEGRILTLNPNLLLHSHFVAFIFERAVCLVVDWKARYTQSPCQPISEAKARVVSLFWIVYFQGADLEEKGCIKEGEVERYV